MKILVYGTGKCGSLIAYELSKKQIYEVYLFDISFEISKRLYFDLKTISRNVFLCDEKILNKEEFDIVIVASSKVNLAELEKLKTKKYYVFSNVSDETYYKMKKNEKFYLCGSLTNNSREFLFFGDIKLSGDHWRETPSERREELRELVESYILPWHYGAVYFALAEIQSIIYNLEEVKADGSIDFAFRG